MGGVIVYDIGPILDRIHDRGGLGGQVDLEADMIAGHRDWAEAEGDEVEAVDKGLASFAVVDEASVALFILRKGLGKFCDDGVLVGELSPAALFKCVVLRPRMSALVGEVDKVVVLCGVDDDERGQGRGRLLGWA